MSTFSTCSVVSIGISSIFFVFLLGLLLKRRLGCARTERELLRQPLLDLNVDIEVIAERLSRSYDYNAKRFKLLYQAGWVVMVVAPQIIGIGAMTGVNPAVLVGLGAVGGFAALASKFFGWDDARASCRKSFQQITFIRLAFAGGIGEFASKDPEERRRKMAEMVLQVVEGESSRFSEFLKKQKDVFAATTSAASSLQDSGRPTGS